MLRYSVLVNTVLQAVLSSDVDSARAALRRQPELVGSRDRTRENRTVLHIAAERGDLAMMVLLLELNANCDVQDSAGDTPVHLAVREGHLQVVRVLLSQGADVRQQNNQGFDAFSEGVSGASTELSEELRRYCYPRS